MTGTGRAVAYLGREGLLERLTGALAAAGAGRASFVVMRGPVGSGTTATARWLLERAGGMGWAGRFGRFAGGLADRPFGALAAIVDEHAAAVEPARLAEHLGGGASALARTAPALRRPLPGIPPAAPLEPPDERLRLFDAYAEFIRRAARDQPLVLVLDELQAADADAAALLAHLLARLDRQSVLVAATWTDYEPVGDGAAEPAAASMLDLARVLPIDGLDRDALGALLVPLASQTPTAAVLALVEQQTDGQPLAALELYQLLRDDGHLGRAADTQLPAAGDLPRGLQAIVAWRAAALSIEARSVVTALACFADGAGVSLVAPVAGLTRPRALAALDEARQRGLVTETDGRLMARHEAIRRALLGTLDGRRRALAFARAAAAIEDQAGTTARSVAPLLAELHFRSAVGGEPPRPAAIRHFLVAAEQARAAAAYGRAADVLAAAARALPAGSVPASGDVVRRLLEAYAEAGLGVHAVETATALLQPARGRSSASSVADVQPLVDAARRLRGWAHPAEAAQLVELGRRLAARGAGEALTSARLELLGESWDAAGAGDTTDGHDQPAPSALTWRQIDDATEALLLGAGDEADTADLFAPQRRRTYDETIALLTLSRDWRRPASLLAALRGACTDLVTRLGRFREAASWAAQYLAAAQRYGSPGDIAHARLFVARCQTVLGELAAADDTLAAAEELLDRIAPPADLADERLVARLTLAHYRDGDWPALAEATAARLAGGPRPASLHLAAEQAVAHARLGDEGAARRLVGAVLEQVPALPPLAFRRDEALFVALAGAWELGWAVNLAATHALLDGAAGEGVGGNHAATIPLARARLLALAGRVAEADAAFANARMELDASGQRPLRAIADHDAGIALAAAGRDHARAAELLGAAAQAFAALGMDGWRARAERLVQGGFEAATQPGGRLHFTYPAGLSRRELDVVRLLADGSSPADAAGALELDTATADRHVASALAKLGADEVAELPRILRRLGLGGAA